MKRIIGFLFIALTALLFSCQNENIDQINTDEGLTEKAATIAQNETTLEAATNETEYEVEFFANAEETLTRWWKMGKRFTWTNKLRYMKQCPEIGIQQGEDDGYPKTITLDYGEGTELKNGKVLSGIIVLEISAPRKSKDYVRSVTYDGFGVDTLTINGYTTSTVDKVDEMFREFSSDLTFTFDNGTEIQRVSERTWQWIEGMDTQENQTDDVIRITGSVDATMGEDQYKKEITNPLKRLGYCKFIVEGTVVITLNGDELCVIDYGDGTCDEFATLTKDGETIEVDLTDRNRWRNKEKEQNQETNQNSNQNGNG